jgi:hypothetical protein
MVATEENERGGYARIGLLAHCKRVVSAVFSLPDGMRNVIDVIILILKRNECFKNNHILLLFIQSSSSSFLYCYTFYHLTQLS